MSSCLKISLSSGSLFTLPICRAFELSAEAGFDGVELIINQDFQRVNPVKVVRSLQEIAPINSIHAPFMPLDGWGGPIQSLFHSIELAADTGIPLVNFHPPSWMGMEIGFWRWLYRIRDFQKEIGIDGEVLVTIENMPCIGRFKLNPNILSSTRDMITFIHDHNLFLTFDTTHMGSGKANFINDFYLFYESGRIRNIHFSDYGFDREHLIPGHGRLPLTRFLNHLKHTDYKGCVTLEVSPHEFPKNEEVILQSLKELQTYMRVETGMLPVEAMEDFEVMAPVDIDEGVYGEL
ncbi:sugar phosphate isomerase/epimerase family protein [Trichlorobacter lovleyi]|uniref:Xylose isomerase domain protein TIM barrel n=1 Tax=Trichlorobacter lovleyi (strain ATCC BAA-1151 / DSM 17278 / SZ) TaxID=398767 RepID=B3E840_TRIL1|nr:sugar phosphate isomerase/epimerase [Trichlorobacter lovleyi]ACD96613.1 Xylose isomerase domain protein TIM barrel [Trichlorobacter lovleyi SZ]